MLSEFVREKVFIIGSYNIMYDVARAGPDRGVKEVSAGIR